MGKFVVRLENDILTKVDTLNELTRWCIKECTIIMDRNFTELDEDYIVQMGLWSKTILSLVDGSSESIFEFFHNMGYTLTIEKGE